MELVIQSGPDAGKVYQLGPNPVVVGRQAGTDITLSDWQVSRRHVQFEMLNGTLMVNDLGSANGTTVNGQRLAPNQPRPLAPGEAVVLGATTIIARPSGPTAVSSSPATPGAFTPAPPNPTYNPAYPAPNYVPPAQPYPAPGPVYPAGYQAPSPAMGFQPPPQNQNRKNNSGLLIGGLVGILLVAGVAILAIFLIGGNKNEPETSAVFIPPTKAVTVSGPPPTIAVTSTPVIGPRGSNRLPPSPAPPTPTVTRAVATTAAATTSAGGKTFTALGATVTFPPNWKAAVDESKSVIAGIAADNITYAEVRRLSGLSGSASDRLTAYVNAVKKSLPDLQVTRAVKAGSGSTETADVYVTYTDKEDGIVRRDFIIAASSTSDTYFIRFSADDRKFDNQLDTFNTILKSIQI